VVYLWALFHYYSAPSCISTLRQLEVKWKSDNIASFFGRSLRFLRHTHIGRGIIKSWLHCNELPASNVHVISYIILAGQGIPSWLLWNSNFDYSVHIAPVMGTTQPPIKWVPGALSPQVKRPRRVAGRSPPTSAEVKNAWIYTSTPSYVVTV
jgi:hypothetical protein